MYGELLPTNSGAGELARLVRDLLAVGAPVRARS